MMLLRETFFFVVCIQILSTTISIPVYFNAQFVPNDPASNLADLFSIDSPTECGCECVANSQCLTATYFGINRTCSLSSAELNKKLLKLVTTDKNTRVFDFGNKTVSMTTSSTTTTTTSVTRSTSTTTATSCSSSGPANLLSIANQLPWTLYSFNYTATNSAPVLSFAVHGGPASETAYLDEVSVVDYTASSVQLLVNPSFENSTSTATGWTIWCASSCATSGDGGQIINSSCHAGSGNKCFMNQCKGKYAFLGQSFSAIVGRDYTISFWLRKNGGPAGEFYANID